MSQYRCLACAASTIADHNRKGQEDDQFDEHAEFLSISANDRDQQTVATGLSTPKDADARLLHRLVRHRFSLPPTVL
jgi:hypothetical protein